LGIAIGCALCLSLPMHEGRALAAGLTARDTAEAKEARQLYKAGQYEAAAEIFLRLSGKYPDMLVLTRNLGACYYYLHRPEPALSNLREYLRREQNITPEDRSEVEGWIAEIEKLRSQTAAAPKTPSAVAPAPPAPVVALSPLAPLYSPPLPPVASPVSPSLRGPATAPPSASAAPLPTPPVVEPVPASLASPGDSGRSAVGEGALDLRQKPAEQAAAPESSSRWWLWTGIGAVVVGGIVSIIVWRVGSGSSPAPERDGTCSPGLSCIVVAK
jgi:tetratricopeptide (TPR) repeat protein